VCWWRRKQMSPQGTGAAALGALAIFHSLPALQGRRYCTPMRHQTQQGRRCCIPSQYRRPAMTPPRPANRKRASSSRRRRRLPLCARAAAAGSRPGARATITTGGTGSEMRRVALIWTSLAATTTSRDRVRRRPARGRQPRILSLYLKE
jgi:hypothetical protein